MTKIKREINVYAASGNIRKPVWSLRLRLILEPFRNDPLVVMSEDMVVVISDEPLSARQCTVLFVVGI